MLHVSNCISISEDSMHEEQILESGSPGGLQLNTTETTFPVAAFHLVKKKPILTLKDAPALWKAPKTDTVCDEVDDQNEADYSDPLLQKLEQLKEIQQQKQEQLKKQQMEQLQRLMEEQKKLLIMVSGHQGLSEIPLGFIWRGRKKNLWLQTGQMCVKVPGPLSIGTCDQSNSGTAVSSSQRQQYCNGNTKHNAFFPLPLRDYARKSEDLSQ